MSDQEGFFDCMFDSADEDPLLQSDEEAMQPSDDGDTHSPQPGPGDQSTSENGPLKVRELVLHQRGDDTKGLEKVNEAIEDGWRLSHISLQDRVRSMAGEVETDIIMLLERGTPRSLFDFGGPR